MSAIINKFIEFVETHKNTFHLEQVNISSIAQLCDNSTPLNKLKLSCDVVPSSLSEVILRNLCKYAPKSVFPLFGLRAIHSILEKDASIDDTFMQQIFLVHATKMQMDVESLSLLFHTLNGMTADTRVDELIEGWEQIVNQTLGNKFVKCLIDELIVTTFGQQLAGRLIETSGCEVDAVFFSSDLHRIRGFSGFNTIYINRKHFDAKFKSHENDVILLDVATLAIHEFAHVRIRQVFDDLNISTPVLISETDYPDPDIGRIAERKLFGCSVDWKFSNAKGAVPPTFVDEFLKAIRCNGDLPLVPANAILYPRLYPVKFYGVGGADVSHDEQ